MKTATILQLDTINQVFYQQTAVDFAASRWKEWPGWKKLLPYFRQQTKPKSQPMIVLDVGCGGGRLARFLHKNLTEQSISYVGVDRGQELLEISQKLAPADTQHWYSEFHQLDLVQSLLANSLDRDLQKVFTQPPQIITLFAVTHHIPSLRLRQELLVTLSRLLPPGGLLLVSSWQFLNANKQRAHLIPPARIGVDDTDWETNDYILDWRSSEKTAYRYCHYTDCDEEISWLKAMRLTTVTDFFADGVARNMNHYLVLKKPV